MNAGPQLTADSTKIVPTASEASRFDSLSVVIPTKNSARTLERCIVSLRSQLDLSGQAFPVEVIVVDNSSTDQTPEIARRLADRFETRGPERCAQRNVGMRLASNEIVIFIDSDMVLEPYVCVQTFLEFENDQCGAVVLPEESFGEGFWAACRSLEKRIALGDPRTEAARGFRVSSLREIGAWNEALTAAEDWDLTDRVVAAGWTISRCQARVLHDEGRPTLRGTFAKKRYYGQWVGAYLEQSDTDSSTVPRSNRRTRLSPLRILAKPRLLVEKPHVTIGLFTLKAIDALGIGLGALHAKRLKGTVRGTGL